MASDPTTKIPLVDDQPANLAVLEAILAGLGVTLVSVTSGEAALREVLAQDFAVVRLDVRMPTMSGYDVARAIRQSGKLPRMVLIALTGWGGESDQQASQEAGFDQHLTKPVSLEALEQALAAAARALP